MSDGAVSAPVDEMVVDPLPPNAAVFEVKRPENRFDDVALVRTVLPLAVRVAALGSVTEPSEAIVVVDVPPKYAVPKFEKSVEDAFANVCSALQELAVVVPKARLIVLAVFRIGYENVSASCFPLNVVQSLEDR